MTRDAKGEVLFYQDSFVLFLSLSDEVWFYQVSRFCFLGEIWFYQDLFFALWANDDFTKFHVLLSFVRNMVLSRSLFFLFYDELWLYLDSSVCTDRRGLHMDKFKLRGARARNLDPECLTRVSHAPRARAPPLPCIC